MAANSTGLPVDIEQGEVNNENCQGPHNYWRKGLRPVSSPVHEHASTNCEGTEVSDDSCRQYPADVNDKLFLDTALPSDLLMAIMEAHSEMDSKQVVHDRTLKEKRFSKDERFDDMRIRQRLKAMPTVKTDVTETKGKQRPMKRFTPGSSSESAFTRQVVKSTSPRAPRRKQLSPANPVRQPLNTMEKQPVGVAAANLCPPTNTTSAAVTRRPPSPNPECPTGAGSEAGRRRVERVRKARLYLLQQTGPNSFLIGGDSPDNKYRIIIGPQRCSCGKGPHCVHVLFIMLRVFQVRETDPCLWSKSLKNYEVESLFRNFHARRTLRLRDLGKKSQPVMSSPTDDRTDIAMPDEDLHSKTGSEDQTEKDEENTCPICLLEMVEGESLTKCDVGCQNQYHHHCVAVWFQECQRQEEPLICPLCRSPWKAQSRMYRTHSREELEAPPNTRASSPLHVTANDIDVLMHNAVPIPAELRDIATPWIQVLGEEHASCFFSKNWVIRELALKHLAQICRGGTLPLTSEGYTVAVGELTPGHLSLHVACSVLAHMCTDPVYKVFVGGLRTLRTLLSYTRCQDSQDQSGLQALLTPVIHTILWKCADSNKRTSHLSFSALQEFVKGQRGELAVGLKVKNTGTFAIGGLQFIVKCIISDPSPPPEGTTWQWYLGCLYALERLIEEYTSEFEVPSPSSDSGTYEQVMATLTFIKARLDHTHAKVARVARRMFYRLARMQTRKDVLRNAVDMLADIDKHLQVHMKRKLLRVASIVSGDTSCDGTSGDVSADLSADVSGDDSSASASQRRTELVLPPTGIDHLSMPIVPPNSPSKRERSAKRSQRKSRARMLGVSEGQPERQTERTLDQQTGVTVKDSDAVMDNGDGVSKLSAGHLDTASQTAVRPAGDSPLMFPSETAYAYTDVADGPPINKDDADKQAASLTDELDGASSSSLQANASDSPPARLSADLSDMTLSPPPPSNGEVVSFKTEVASSPKHTPTRHTVSDVSSEPCLCKEEMEKEEAKALVEAMEKSSVRQDTLPYVPGLSRLPSETTLTIHVQNQPAANQVDGLSVQPYHYLEGSDWLRGQTIGTGAFSTCYQARDTKTGTLMAVKQISFCRNSLSEQDLVVDAVREEIELMAKLNHPNIVRILGATQQACHFFMFVEWMPGGSVAGLLDMYGAFNDHVITNYTQQIIRGLAHLHENQILHRDLKGANLLVDGTGQRLRIGDFGASARLSSRLTVAGEFQGQLLGTIAFMAPEVLRGESYGRSCDVWSIGCTMVEMATTKPPWGASDISNHLALIFKIASTDCAPPIPEFLSPAVRDLMLRCLECNRDDRPSASELLKHPLFTSCR